MKSLKSQIQNTLQLRPDLVAKIKTEVELLNLIEQLVQELVNRDFESLLRLLYRIDVNENKVKKAIGNSSPEGASLSIAKLILEREKEKAITKEKYNGNNTDWEF